MTKHRHDPPIGSRCSRAEAGPRNRSHLTIDWSARGAACFAGFLGVVMDEIDAVTEAALRARSGDAAAARVFVRATQTDVWRLCAHLSTRSLADDLTQETYARAFASLHRFAGRSSVRTWLLSIARRVCADAVRAAVRSRTLAPAEDEIAERATADPAESVMLRMLLAGLDRDRREAFVLTQLVGLSYAEAAQVCGCPVGTIRSRVARARGDLVAAVGGRAPRSASG
jgi:RNA polymerase sigma-70 factor (ECF subfamily)